MAATKELLARRANQIRNGGKENTVFDLIQKMRPQINKALPSFLNAERFVRICLTELRRNPQLLSCSKESLLGAVMLSAQLGLEPGPLGLCYFVPYKGQINFIIGYRGMIELARRSGQISLIYAETVHENDFFEYELGLEPKLRHIPVLMNRGKPYAWYGVCKFRDGGSLIRVMGMEEIERHMKRSPSYRSSSSPWVTDFEEMAKKTVIRSMFRYFPITPEIVSTGIPDEGVVKGVADEDMVEVEFVEQNSEQNSNKEEKKEEEKKEQEEPSKAEEKPEGQELKSKLKNRADQTSLGLNGKNGKEEKNS